MIVTKIGGAVCLDPATIRSIAQAWTNSGGPLCIVHGGGPQLNNALADLDEPVRRIDGLRVTSPEAAIIVAEVLDSVGTEITALLRRAGVPAVHVAATTGAIHAVPKESPRGLGRVGTFTAFDATALPDDAEVFVITPVGWDAQGALNINADEAATGIASAVDAHRLHLITDVPGFLENDRVVPVMSPGCIKRAIKNGVARGGMAVKLRNACEALAYGLPEVHIGDVDSLAHGTGTTIQPALEVIPRQK